MLTINFLKTLGVEKFGVYEGTYWYSQQMKSSYVPRIGEAVKFPDSGDADAADEDLETHKVEDVVLNARSGELEISLESFTYDAADIDGSIDDIERLGFKLISFEKEQENDDVV